MTETGKRPSGPIDALWLAVDRATNRMTIVGLAFLESPPDWSAVTSRLRERVVARFPVFRQHPVHAWWRPGPLEWEDDRDFSLERHLRRVTLPPPGDDAALRVYLETNLPRPFDRRHPLWEAHFIDGFGEGAVLFMRAHHALADGIAMSRVIMSLTDDAPDAAGASDAADVLADLIAGRVEALVAERAAELAAGHPAGPAAGGHGGGAGGARLSRLARLGMVTAPREVAHLAHPSSVVEAVGLGSRTAQVVADVLCAQTPSSVLGGTPGVRKHVVWSDAVPLPELKAVGRLAGATLNDVVMSAVAGALHRYQIVHGAQPVDLVTLVPVNVRALDKPLPSELGNRFALVFLTYPSATAAPLARLAETKRRMDWVKRSPEATITFGLMNALGLTPRPAARRLVDFFANKAIGVTTNVAGPRTPRYLAGVPVTGLLAWVPGSGRHTVGVCVVTYAATVRVGFMVDAGAVPDPQVLLAAFESEVETLATIGRSATGAQ